MPNCANCGAPLRAGGHGVLVCGHCGSLDEGAAVYNVETVGASAVPCPRCGAMLDDARIEGFPVRHCPSCQGRWATLFGGPGNIVLDTCERCGVNWLDPGELQRIAQAP
jgi:Zn-finger nucleic acid-binding protein